MSKIVAIVGRPNVGKSTLFNRLVGQREAIVDPTSGVTRDRHYGLSDWNGHQFSVIDTGGYVDDSGDIFESEIRKQVNLAIDEADVILFVVDAREGVTIMDEDVAKILRRSGKKAILVPNKIDSVKQVNMVHEFYSLGIEDIFGISAVNGSGTGELLDAVTALFPPLDESSPENNDELPDLPKISIVGRPNAGKSSLINFLLGNERTIVTPLPGTTRDSIHSEYKSFGLNFLLVDTAGIRKKGKVKEDIEFYSVMRAIRSIEHSDVCLLMVDAERGFEAQDLNIFHIIDRNHKGVVIVVNKWDLVVKQTNTHKQFEELIREQTAPFRDVPIVFTSVTEKQRILKAMETAVAVYKNRMRQIPTRELNDFILPLIEQTPPPAVKGKYVRIKFATQLPTAFPSFVFFCNHPQYLKDPYRRFIENKLRERFDFTGAPMEIFFRQK